MMSRRPRWECPICGRKKDIRLVHPRTKACYRCSKKTTPELFSLALVPDEYFEKEKQVVGDEV